MQSFLKRNGPPPTPHYSGGGVCSRADPAPCGERWQPGKAVGVCFCVRTTGAGLGVPPPPPRPLLAHRPGALGLSHQPVCAPSSRISQREAEASSARPAWGSGDRTEARIYPCPSCVGCRGPATQPLSPFQIRFPADQPGAASCLFSAPAAPVSPPSLLPP